MGKTYFWIEDRKDKAGYTFWYIFMNQLCPEVIVESKKNNSELIKAVRQLKDTDNKYIVVFDNSFDNLQVYQEFKTLKKYVEMKENVLLMDIICFEYVLLEFDKLVSWIYAPNDEFLLKRINAVKAREKLVKSINAGDLDYKSIREIMEYNKAFGFHNHNIEQLSAKLLFDLTRNTGFEVSKGMIGVCWTVSCCDWPERGKDDVCGLENQRLSLMDKMKSIYAGTILSRKLPEVGLEVLR